MTNTNKTELAKLREAFKVAFHEHARIEPPLQYDASVDAGLGAVLAKLPGMPAVEWLKEHERLARAFGGAEYDYGYVDGDGDQELTAAETRSDAARDTLLAHARQRIEPAASEADPPWRCFHCNEVFTNAVQAEQHFGKSQTSGPACQVDIAKYREMEILAARYQEEDTDLHREIHRLQSEHAVALGREEEKGYARGLKDGASEAGAVPVDAHAVIQEMIGVATTDEADSDWHPDHKTMVDQWQSRLQIALNLPAAPPSAPAAQPEKQAGQSPREREMEAAINRALKSLAGDYPSMAADLRASLNAAPPAPIQQAAPGAEPVPDSVIATVWRAAMTAACNIIIERQNRLNDDDGPSEVMSEQGACIAAIKRWLEVDEQYLGEIRAMLCAAPAAEPKCRTLTDADMDQVAGWLGEQERGDIGFQAVCERIIHAFAMSAPAAESAQPFIVDAQGLIPRLQSLLDRMCNDERTAAMFEADGDTLRDAIRLLRAIKRYQPTTATADAQGDERARALFEQMGCIADDEKSISLLHAALSRQPSATASAEMPKIQRFNPIAGLGMNPHSTGLYVRYEDHCAALAAAKTGDAK